MNKQTAPSSRAYFGWLTAIIVLGVLLRLSAAGGDLWLDEIWQLQTVRSFHSIWDQFDLRISGAQPSAYTSLLYLIGSEESPLMRIPSLLFGILSIPLVAFLTFPRGKLLSIIATFLFSISYPMVLYGSEARGYSAMIFFGLLAWITVDRGIRNNKPILAPLFWASSLLAILFQPISLQLYTGLLCWSVVHTYRATPRRALRISMWWHGPTLLCIVCYYALFLRHISPLDGPTGSRLEVVLNTASLLLGGPQLTACVPALGFTALGVAILALSVVGSSVFRLFRHSDDVWVFYLASIVLAPTAMVVATNPASFSVRYLLPALVAAIPLISGFLVRQQSANRFSSAMVVLTLVAITFGNYVYIKQLLTNGRAQYRSALEYIINQSEQLPTTLASANDFRGEMITNYFGTRVSNPGTIQYQPKSASGAPSVWYLAHGYDRYCAPADQLSQGGVLYKFEKLFDFSTLSGWQWYLYRKVSS